MLLDRLIQRERPESILQGSVLLVDPMNRRVQVRMQNGMELWVSYLPEEFPRLAAEQLVMIGRGAGNYFLIRKVITMAPESASILEL